mmetsp:Transcript_25413/g.59002  ORF Transcript_25413/g.59002 Transcript_25413/m.59002 type:complete len:357 (+) Transcript_25413:62-1132(+)
MPSERKFRWLGLALSTLGFLSFVDFCHDHHLNRQQTSCRVGKRILEVRRGGLHESPPCIVDQYTTLVETVRHEDGGVELGAAPVYSRPVPGSTLTKEVSRDQRGQTLLEKVKPHLALASSDAVAALGSEPFLFPRKILGQLLLWVACDPEFDHCAWQERLRNFDNPPFAACWTEQKNFGLPCLAMFLQDTGATWKRWPDYGAAFEQLAAPRAGTKSDYYRIVAFALGSLQAAVYSEVDAATEDGATIELKTISPRGRENFADQRLISLCFQMLTCGCKNLCLGTVDNEGQLVDVEEMSLKELSAWLARSGAEVSVLLGRVAAALAEIRSACLRERDSASSFTIHVEGDALCVDVVE